MIINTYLGTCEYVSNNTLYLSSGIGNKEDLCFCFTVALFEVNLILSENLAYKFYGILHGTWFQYVIHLKTILYLP